MSIMKYGHDASAAKEVGEKLASRISLLFLGTRVITPAGRGEEARMLRTYGTYKQGSLLAFHFRQVSIFPLTLSDFELADAVRPQEMISLTRVPSLRPIVGPIAVPRSDPVVEIQRSTNPDPSSGGIVNYPDHRHKIKVKPSNAFLRMDNNLVLHYNFVLHNLHPNDYITPWEKTPG
ncbi:hypothetical protein K445DRAFT_14911 [Daldinia sp. EC12]|nr:hypothetical protein K445DRAFT_14911 [Daldinia sp. EC12]